MLDLKMEEEIHVFNKIEEITTGRRKKVVKCWNCKHPLESGINNIVCPKCSSEFAEKPINEAKYHILQKKYLETRDNNTLGKMLLIVKDVAYNVVCGKLKASGKFLDDELINDKTSWVVEKMFNYYSKKPDFSIKFSAIDYISQVCLYVLYGHEFKVVEQNEISIDAPVGSNTSSSKGNREQTLLEYISSESCIGDNDWEIENYIFKEIYKENIVNELSDFVSFFLRRVSTKWGWTHTFKLTNMIQHFFNGKSNRFLNSWYRNSPSELFDHFEGFKRELRDCIFLLYQKEVD